MSLKTIMAAMPQQQDKDERRKAGEQRISELLPKALDALADLVAAGYGPAIDVVKKYGLEAEIEQRLRDPGKT